MVVKANKPRAGKLSVEEFVKQAIVKLRTGGYKGIHTRFSGFNQAFRDYFGEDPVAATKQLSDKGVIALRFARGGAMIYLKGEEPPEKNGGAGALAKMGIA